jgi:signal transduction histidine kinase
VVEARRVIAGLRPAALDDFGLAAAVRLEIEGLFADGRQVTYKETPGTERLSAAPETALFRVAQEALTNIRKHAGPTRVFVARQRHESTVHLEVRDWGIGFTPVGEGHTRPGEQIGLAGMHERMALVRGTCAVASQPGQGTRILIEAPLPAAPDGRQT